MRSRSHPLACDLRPALEERREFVGGAEVPVARLALVDRAVGDVVGVLDQAQVAGSAVLEGEEINNVSFPNLRRNHSRH